MADVDIEINTDLHKVGKEEINDEDLIQYDSDGGEAQEDGGTFDLEEPVMADNQGGADNQDFDTNGDATALEDQIEDEDPVVTEHDITQPEDMSLLDAAADAAENDGELVVEEPMEGQEDEAEAVDAGDIDYDISLDVGETSATAEDAAITEVVEVDQMEPATAPTATDLGDGDNDEIGWEHDEESAPSALFAAEEEQPTADAADTDDHTQDGIQEIGTTANEFPSITVHYKGEEFPFLAHSNGFFSDASILDETMDKLLSSLRTELENELTEQDEVVFQVDELGLEFSQSSLQDSMASLTLRQILEIFDLLVKNQDPDNSRTLFTYVIIRPNTSKRYDALVESAASGKGLDEVIHLFQPTLPSPDTGTADHSEDYDSPEVEGFRMQEAEVDADEDDDEDYDNNDEEDEEEEEDNDEADNIEEEVEVEAEAEAEDSEEPDADESETLDLDDMQEPNHMEEGDGADGEEPEHEHLDEVIFEEAGARTEPGAEDATYFDESLQDEDGNAADGFFGQDVTLVATDFGTVDDDVAEEEEEDLAADILASTTNEDEMGEIDWQEDEDADGGEADESSVNGKRPRAEDGAGVEDEQDAKRVRS